MRKMFLSTGVWVLILWNLVLLYFIGIPSRSLLTDLFFSSDALYLPALLRDLFAGGSLSSWHLPPAPYLFPDLPLYLSLHLTNGGANIAFMDFASLQFLLMAWSLNHLLEGTDPDPKIPLPFLSLLSFALPLLFALADREDLRFAYLLLSAHHTGALLGFLFSSALFLRILKGEGGMALRILFAVTSLLFFISDGLYTLLFAVPSLLFLAIPGNRIPFQKRAAPALWILLPFALSGLLLRLFRSTGWLQIQTFHPLLDVLKHFDPSALMRGAENFAILINGSSPFLLFTVVLFYAATWALLFYEWNKRGRDRARTYLLFAFAVNPPLLLFAVYLLSVFVHPDLFALRYLTPLFTLPLLFPALAGIYLPERVLSLLSGSFHGETKGERRPPKKDKAKDDREKREESPRAPRIKRIASHLIQIALLILTSLNLYALGGKDGFLRYRPPGGICADRMFHRYGANLGYASYWNAKQSAYYSREGVTVLQLERDLSPRLWINAEKGYDSLPKKGARFFFIAEGLDRPAILENFGEPTRSESCGGREYLIYEGGEASTAALRRLRISSVP